jgi:glyceraldehyde-3-phosphate dehydrogenase (NADP+)
MLIAGEAAKPYKYAMGEVKRAVQTFRVAAGEALRLPGEYLQLDWTAAGEGREGVVKYFPRGPVAAISPFNFPLNLAVHKVAPAIAAGCPVVLKPATRTPLATLELAKIIYDSGLPEAAVSLLPMDRKTGDKLITDERFRMLTFTGSPEVGWAMRARAGRKKVTLELGGNAGVIVTPSANLQHAVERSVFGGFAYSGQVCIHAQRFYVHESIFEAFTEQFVRKADSLKVGSPQEEDTDISAMIDVGNAERVEEWVKEAEKQGAKILTGGTRSASYVAPTVLINTQNTMNVCAKEVFGPVVAIEKYTDFKEAVAAVNDSRYGLQAGVFTDSLSEMNIAHNQLEVGGVIINDVPTFRVDHMPYGGVKDSGIGREGVKYTIQEMMEPRILVKYK